MKCLSCLSENLVEFISFRDFERVTSDSKIYKKDGRLYCCVDCDLVQKSPTSKWIDEINEIYANYSAYHQSNGMEQKILDPKSKQMINRSEFILKNLSHVICNYKNQSKWIDIGCGTGVTLSAVYDNYKNISLYGYDLNRNSISYLEKIDNFVRLYSDSFDEIDGTFSFMSAIHVLEHVISPKDWIKSLGRILDRDGSLIIEVCDLESNPFDLIVADHLTHFTIDTLNDIFTNSNLNIDFISRDLVPKELTAVLSKSERKNKIEKSIRRNLKSSNRELVNGYLDWMTRLVELSNLTISEDIGVLTGIWGSSNAAAWLSKSVSHSIDFYVDDDPSRHGGQFLGKPIYSSENIPWQSNVILGLASSVALSIYERKKSDRYRLILPPQLNI